MPFRQFRPRIRLKIFASALLALPIFLLLLLALGEMASGDESGAQHILQAAPLIVLLIAAWRFPYAAGIVLLALVALLLPTWLFFVLTGDGLASGDTPVLIWMATGIALFMPPFVAGWLLVKAGSDSIP